MNSLLDGSMGAGLPGAGLLGPGLAGNGTKTLDVPTSHPRYQSLMVRERIVDGVQRGLTSPHGLLAHGRGEAFDYLIGERTQPFALEAITAAAALLLLAQHPVLSVNGNVAALMPEAMVQLAAAIGCPIEVNIFHASAEREQAIAAALRAGGAVQVLLPEDGCVLPSLDSNRRRCHPDGIFKADVVFVPLEDGDRCAALVRTGKQVITIDLNPASRTARTATISIVDNLLRVLPLLTREVERLRGTPHRELQALRERYVLATNLRQARACIVSSFGDAT